MLEVNENEIETIIVIANKANSKLLGMREYFPLMTSRRRNKANSQVLGMREYFPLITSRIRNKANSQVLGMREYFPLMTSRRRNKANSQVLGMREYFPLLTSRRYTANSQVQGKSENISSFKECEHWSKQSVRSPFDSRRENVSRQADRLGNNSPC
jgi:hypothetical protein